MSLQTMPMKTKADPVRQSANEEVENSKGKGHKKDSKETNHTYFNKQLKFIGTTMWHT